MISDTSHIFYFPYTLNHNLDPLLFADCFVFVLGCLALDLAR